MSVIFKAIKKNSLLVLMGSLVVVGGVFYYLRSGDEEYLKVSYDDLVIERTRILKNLKFGKGIESDVVVSNQQMTEVERRLLNVKDLAANYNYFYQIEAATGVKLDSLKQLEYEGSSSRGRRRKSSSAFDRIRFQMIVTGRFAEVLNFVRGLEGGGAFFQVEDFKYVKDDELPGMVSLGMSLLMLGEKEAE